MPNTTKLTSTVEWISFKERQPTDPEEYLIGGTDGPVTVLEFDGTNWLFESGIPGFPMPLTPAQIHTHTTLTHWAALPTLPKAA